MVTNSKHNLRTHAAISTDDYTFSQLIPYIGNKRKLLNLIGSAVESTGVQRGTFVDLFTGSTVVARWAKRSGFRVVANDWEPYSYQIARGTVELNTVPGFAALGGVDRVFAYLNSLPPVRGYVATNLCPADDDRPDVMRERMFFTRANGEKIDAIGNQLQTWLRRGDISDMEKAYIDSALLYSVSYVSNTSGLFKGFHNGWGGKTGTAKHRILSKIALRAPLLHDNGLANVATMRDAQLLAGGLVDLCGGTPDIVYLDPPYNQHPYGSNYHILNTMTLWDSPAINSSILVDGRKTNKSAIRQDWKTERRSPYNYAKESLDAFTTLLSKLSAKWIMVSYSTDGHIRPRDMINVMADLGQVSVFTETYKRYRVSKSRPSARATNVEFVLCLQIGEPGSRDKVNNIVDKIENGT